MKGLYLFGQGALGLVEGVDLFLGLLELALHVVVGVGQARLVGAEFVHLSRGAVSLVLQLVQLALQRLGQFVCAALLKAKENTLSKTFFFVAFCFLPVSFLEGHFVLSALPCSRQKRTHGEENYKFATISSFFVLFTDGFKIALCLLMTLQCQHKIFAKKFLVVFPDGLNFLFLFLLTFVMSRN